MAWKVVASLDDVKPKSIYQEKCVVIANKKESEALYETVVKSGGEFCEVPSDIKMQFPQAFAYWANKTDSEVRIQDIIAGNIRIQVEDEKNG